MTRLPTISAAEHAHIHQAATCDHARALLNAKQWVVACLYHAHGQASIAAVNVYTDLVRALIAYDQLGAEARDGHRAVLLPVGPVTEAEFAACTAREDAVSLDILPGPRSEEPDDLEVFYSHLSDCYYEVGTFPWSTCIEINLPQVVLYDYEKRHTWRSRRVHTRADGVAVYGYTRRQVTQMIGVLQRRLVADAGTKANYIRKTAHDLGLIDPPPEE